LLQRNQGSKARLVSRRNTGCTRDQGGFISPTDEDIDNLLAQNVVPNDTPKVIYSKFHQNNCQKVFKIPHLKTIIFQKVL